MQTNVVDSTPEQLRRGLDLVAEQIAAIRDDEWDAPTPCTEWSVRDIVIHLVGLNRVLVAVISGQRPPQRGQDPLGDDPAGAFRESSAALVTAFEQPGVLEQSVKGPLGEATGAERLRIRLADLLMHSWDLSRATGRPLDLPEDLIAQAEAFAAHQLDRVPRVGRFALPKPAPENASPMDKLAALAGRTV